jgi:hypothetical protein
MQRAEMKKSFTRIPWFYILITFYPLLFLWAVNISQIDPAVVIRPFLFTLLGSAILYGMLYLVFHKGTKAALIGTLLLIAFFTYGDVYYAARNVPALNIFNHHLVLFPIYLLVLGVGIWGILRIKKYDNYVLYLNTISLVLVLLQVVELSYAYIRTSYAASRPVKLQSGLTLPTNLKDMPDIYVIVLDTYMRSDALKQDLGYDNSAFINQLNQMGFYVASCGHPNYTFTYASISSLLDMRYIPGAYANDVWDEFSNNGFWSGLLKNTEVHQQLESVGYKTVAFQEPAPLVQFDDSDILIGVDHPTISSQYLYPFEAIYVNSTAAILLNALDPKGRVEQLVLGNFASKNAGTVDFSGVTGVNRDLVISRATSTLFILNHLLDVPAIAGPKFTYAHIFVPHTPFVFGPDGEIMTDPGFYSSIQGKAVSDEYEKQGYLNQIQYIDKAIVPVLHTLISKSKRPPIIVLLGDHGLQAENRNTDLLAYYLPNGSGKLYPSISPVNSFRLIFDEYFGANYPLLPDLTYVGDNMPLTGDPYPACAK